METGTRKIILALGIIAGVLGLNYGGGIVGIPNLFTYLPTISMVAAGILILGISIPVLASISQNSYAKAGLSKVGEMAKADQSIKLRRRFRKGYLTRLRNKSYAKIDAYLAKYQAISRWNKPEGYQPKSFEDNRVLLFAIMDYALRLDIFIAKWFSIKKTADKVGRLNNELGEWNKVPRFDLQLEIRDLRSGSDSGKGWAELYEFIDRTRSIKGTKKSYNADELKAIIDEVRRGERSIFDVTRAHGIRMKVDELLKQEQDRKYGWTQFDSELIGGMNKVTELMFNSLRVGADDRKRMIVELRMVRDNLRSKADNTAITYNKFSKRVSMYGIHHEIDSFVMNAYDMYNPAGSYEHHYLVTSPDALFRKREYHCDLGDTEKAAEGIEVDEFGFEVDATNESNVKGKNARPRKLFDPRRMSDFIHHVEMFELLQIEWYIMLENFRFGRFATKTRRVPDYAEAFKPESKKDVHLDDDSVTFTEKGGTAFDRRALANPGNLPFKGRKLFNTRTPTADDVDDKYPMLTTAGMQDYMRLLIESREREFKTIIDEFLTKFPDDAGGWPDSEEDLNNVVRFARRSNEGRQAKNG